MRVANVVVGFVSVNVVLWGLMLAITGTSHDLSGGISLDDHHALTELIIRTTKNLGP